MHTTYEYIWRFHKWGTPKPKSSIWIGCSIKTFILGIPLFMEASIWLLWVVKAISIYKPCIHHSPTRQQSVILGSRNPGPGCLEGLSLPQRRRSSNSSDRKGWAWIFMDFCILCGLFFRWDFHGLSYLKKCGCKPCATLIPVYNWDWAGFVGINPTRNRIQTSNMGMPQGYSRISQRIW